LLDLDSVMVWLSRAEVDVEAYARRLVLEVAAATFDVPRSQVRLSHESGGRPRVHIGACSGEAELHVALSHTRGAVAVALTALGPVGVDAERVRPLPALALGRRWLCDAEARWLSGAAATAQTAGFLLLWTQKEAVGKALGVGLRGGGMRREMPRPTSPLGAGFRPAAAVRPGRLRRVPGLSSMAVAAWPVGEDFVVSVACDAPAALGASIVFRELESNRPSCGMQPDGHDVDFGSAVRSTARSRTTLPVAVRGICSTT
jgi:4'-phosphopantetheinyl transferase